MDRPGGGSVNCVYRMPDYETACEYLVLCRRLLAASQENALDEDAARDFLEAHGYHFDDLRGLVLKLDRCGACMAEDDVVDLAIFRVRLGTL